MLCVSVSTEDGVLEFKVCVDKVTATQQGKSDRFVNIFRPVMSQNPQPHVLVFRSEGQEDEHLLKG